MDSNFKTSDIGKKILETRKQTEELKVQLQNLIDSGINSSIEHKTISHSHLDKENITESQNKVQIIKSYDTAHSQHVIKPSSSKSNLSDNKRDTKPTECKKTKNYDVNKAREYMKKQREKRLEEQKLQNEKKIQVELQKKKLQELQKKSLELVKRNIQAKRERSKSRDRVDFVRPIKDISRSRSSSRERVSVHRNKISLENINKRGKSVEPVNTVRLEKTHINPNLLYPPQPHYLLNTNETKNQPNQNSNKFLPVSGNEIIIISRNSSDNKVKTPNSVPKTHMKTLKPKNLFDITKVTEEMTVTNTKSPNSSEEMHTIRGNDIQKNNTLKKLENGIEQKSLKFINPELSHVRNSQSFLDIETNKDIQYIAKMLESKNTHNKNISCLHSPENSNIISTNLNINNSNKTVKPKLSEVAIGTSNLEKITKETQTSGEPKQEYPLWLQEKQYESNPLNFINSVKRKLQNAINSPKLHVDVGIQNSLVQSNLKSDPSHNNSEEIIEFFNQSNKSSKKSELKSFISHKCLNLDQKTIENIELIPKKVVSENIINTETYETESESDTSKNIPEISSESGTSLKKNAESVKQNGTMGLDLEKLNFMKLNTRVDKSTHSIQSNKTQQKEVMLQTSKINIESTNTKYDILDSKIEKKKACVKIFSGSDQYTSDFQSGSPSIITENSSLQKSANVNAANNSDYHLLSDPQITMYLEKHSGAIPETSDSHSKKTKSSKSINSKEKYFKISSRNVTIRDTSQDKIDLGKKETSSVKGISSTSTRSDVSSNIHTETDAKESQSVHDESQKNESKSSVRSSKKSDKFVSLYTDSHPTASVSEKSKSDSNMKYVNTHRGLHISSGNNDYLGIPPLKEPTLSLVRKNEKDENILDQTENRNKLLKNISVRSDANKFADLNNTNEIHLKFEAEIHLLNDFNESLRQFSEVEKAFNSLKSKNDVAVAPNKVLQNRDTQTSVLTKSPTTSKFGEENVASDAGSELSTINFSRGFLIDHDSTSLNIDDTSKAEDDLNLTVNNSLSNFENLHSHNFAGMTLRMFEQLIKDEDARLENLKTILKIREQALLDRTKGELAWLEIQRKHLRETGKLHKASLIKKKQRGILVNHQKERHEMQRLKQMQKAASIERKIILKEQRNLIKHQLSTNKMLSKIKVNTPRERRHSGPLKVIQSHTESIRSETSVSKRSSSDKEAYSIMSHTQSIVSMVSEVSGDEVVRKTATHRGDFMDLAVKLPGDACEVPVSEIKRTLLIREAALQKRRKAAEELLQWHRKLLEEEKRITELESTANTIISQIPSTGPANSDVNERYQFKGKQLNQLWFNLTSCKETKFNEDKIYPMSQIALERFCKSAREYSTKTKKLKRISDGEVSENSVMKTDDSVSENIPDLKVLHSASIRTESEQSDQSKAESVPITTTNDYTSDFDIESLHEVVNIEDMDVVDQSINRLIDNFNKIQGDISLLGIKQSVKSDVEPEESIKSEKTDSDAEVSVIETAKTSKEKYFEEEENNKVSSSSKNVSTLQDIVNNLSQDEKICDTSSKLVEDESTSKSVEGKIVMGVPETHSMSEISSKETSYMDKFKNSKSLDITEVPSMIDKNSLTENNLNKSQEILEEIGKIVKDTPNEDSTPEENSQFRNETQDNLSKSEEILSRLNQSKNNSSIISEPNKDLLQNEVEEEDSIPEATDVLLELQPMNNKISSVASSMQETSKDETNEIIDEDLSENKIGRSIHDSQDVISSNKSSIIIMDELSIKTDNSENIIFSKRSPLVSSRSKEKEELLKSARGKIDLKSEIVSEVPIKTIESREAEEIAEEPTINSAIDELSKSSSKPSTTPETDHLAGKFDLQEERKQAVKGKDVIGWNETESEEITTSDPHSTKDGSQEMTDLLNGARVSLIINRFNLTVDDISEKNLENNKEVDRLSSEGSQKPEQKTINDINAETKDESIYEVIISEATKITEEREIDDCSSADSKKNAEEIRSKSSKTAVSENISVEKSWEGDSEKLSFKNELEQQSLSDIPSTTEDSEKSRVASVPEIAPLSKEETNFYEEKESDSSRSTTVSQSNIILSDKEVSEKSEISMSEEKSPRSVSVDVKKRVSEIMADASPVSRGDKSPKLQDFYTTTYDLVSPANSPELGSPTEEHKFLTAKSIFGTEAEELLRKQLAIEQEIKQITEQQQKEQLPYLFVREIPNKPPPPYTPPSSLPAANVITIIPTSEEIEGITKYSAKILHKAYLSNNLENISISENTLSLISKDINKECYKFIFDLCKEIAKKHYKRFEKEDCVAWLQVRKNPQLAVVKPLDVKGLEKHMNKKLKELFGYEKPIRRENAIIKWSRKKRDHVDEILVMESQAEETQWTNYDKDELLVMNDVTNEIMNMLLKETGEVVSKILSKQTF